MAVNFLANSDNECHSHPLLRTIAYLIPLGQDLVAFHHHILLDHHPIGLIVFVFVQMAILGQLFQLLGQNVLFLHPYFLLPLSFELFFWLESIRFIFLFKIFIALLSLLIVWQFAELSKFAHLVILLHKRVQLAHDATFRTVTALYLSKHAGDGLSIFLSRKLIVGVL